MILLYTTTEKFEVGMIFYFFFKVSIKSLMFIKTVFIWLNIGL